MVNEPAIHPLCPFHRVLPCVSSPLHFPRRFRTPRMQLAKFNKNSREWRRRTWSRMGEFRFLTHADEFAQLSRCKCRLCIDLDLRRLRWTFFNLRNQARMPRRDFRCCNFAKLWNLIERVEQTNVTNSLLTNEQQIVNSNAVLKLVFKCWMVSNND